MRFAIAEPIDTWARPQGYYVEPPTGAWLSRILWKLLSWRGHLKPFAYKVLSYEYGPKEQETATQAFLPCINEIVARGEDPYTTLFLMGQREFYELTEAMLDDPTMRFTLNDYQFQDRHLRDRHPGEPPARPIRYRGLSFSVVSHMSGYAAVPMRLLPDRRTVESHGSGRMGAA